MDINQNFVDMRNEKKEDDKSNHLIEGNYDINVQDIQINLRLLGDVKENEKLMVSENKYLMVDGRPLQLIQRWWSDDSRSRTIEFINQLIGCTKEYCESIVLKIEENQHNKENFEELLRFQGLLNSSIIGINRLTVTYGNDKLSRAKLETIISKIRTFCDMDLKKAVKLNV